MHCNKVSYQELLDCFDNNLWNNLENNVDNLEHNAEKLQEILNRIMQRIMRIITSALFLVLLTGHFCEVVIVTLLFTACCYSYTV